MSRATKVTVIFYCGHQRIWVEGEHPKRNSLVPCLRCDGVSYVKQIIRGVEAA